MTGKLYVVGTPIGNLSDFSPRAAECLRNCDFIAAEDTRVTLKLLNRFDIKKPLISYFEHNRRERGEIILARILGGESCALVTDAANAPVFSVSVPSSFISISPLMYLLYSASASSTFLMLRAARICFFVSSSTFLF